MEHPPPPYGQARARARESILHGVFVEDARGASVEDARLRTVSADRGVASARPIPPAAVATVALIFWVALWHVAAFLPLLPGFPPALLVSALTWLFAGWVWPNQGEPPTTTPEGVSAWLP